MSFGWTLAGTIMQLLLGGFLFMLVIFSAAGIANNIALGRRALRILTLSIYLLPALCALSAVMVLYLYWHGGSAASYGWYALPLLATVLYLAYAFTLNRRH